MKELAGRVIIAVFLVGMSLLGAPSIAQADRPPGDFGIGLGAATVPSGISFKTYTGKTVALQGVVGSWRGHGEDWRVGVDSFGVGLDLLYEMPSLAELQLLELGWNYGVGAGAGVDDDGEAVLGGTGVLGLEFNFNPAPIDFVIEYRPGLYIDDGLQFEFADATGHLRWWF
jgi:hypothetical protein